MQDSAPLETPVAPPAPNSSKQELRVELAEVVKLLNQFEANMREILGELRRDSEARTAQLRQDFERMGYGERRRPHSHWEEAPMPRRMSGYGNESRAPVFSEPPGRSWRSGYSADC